MSDELVSTRKSRLNDLRATIAALTGERDALKHQLYAQEPLVAYALNAKRMRSRFVMAGGVGAHNAYDEYQRRMKESE